MKRGIQVIMELPFVRGPAVLLFSYLIARHLAADAYWAALFTYAGFEFCNYTVARIRRRVPTQRRFKLRPHHIEALRIVQDGNWHDVMSARNAADPNRGLCDCATLYIGFFQCTAAGLLEDDARKAHIWVRITDKGRQALEECERGGA
jgi:hypothetical protein